MPAAELPRKLGLLDATCIVVGIIIGSGIFLVPQAVAQAIPSTGAILAAWVLAGALSLIGALAFAELGAMLPDTGGQYVYLREAYGPLWGFLWGWALLLAIRSGGTATLAVAFAIYLGYLIPLTPSAAKLVSVAMIALFTWVNYRGVRPGAVVQNVFTFLKVAGLAALIGAAFLSPLPSVTEWTFRSPELSWSRFGVALIACFWANQGWFSVSIVAGEIRNPGRNIPLALGFGVAIATSLYIIANLAYLRVLTIAEIAAAPRVAAPVAERAIGPQGAALVSLLIILSITGALNGGLLTGPRAYFAQARDGLFFRAFSRIHPRYETPGPAILLQGAWAAALAASGTYQKLFSYVIFVSWVFYGLTVLAVPILRRRRPDLPRPYKTWGYPVTPAIFLAVTSWFLVNALITTPGPSVAGAAILAGAVPLYAYWRRSRGVATGGMVSPAAQS
jgi:APA family basic amino acid/polyamine antiporter